MNIQKWTLLALMALVAFTACNNNTSEAKQNIDKDTLGSLNAPYSDVFYDSLKTAMSSYYSFKEALVRADSVGADEHALSLQHHLDSLPFATAGGDTTKIVLLQEAASNIHAEIAGMLLEKSDLEKRRASFEAVSDMLYDFVKATGLKGATVYRQFCPMAFNDRGAYWLSDKSVVRNPYFGDEMLGCGEVTDTLQY
ncbi:DUF3347 domain-containing protein [Chitinophaga skermanii]|nr:DUF3347 domain-containing protein [Chitinophaga skermanii]